MVQQKTKDLVKNALESSFNLNNFKLFINNLLNQVDFSKSQRISPEEIGSEFKEHIKECYLIGKYTDKEDKTIHILTVQFNNESSIERARTLQRNFIAKYLKYNPGINSSLVAFFQEDSPDWRFSFVKLDLSLNEKGNIEYDFTPARRYSFLVGKNEFSHTAQSQLAPIIENEGDIYISDVEECFQVEKVTKEFFEEYTKLYKKLYSELGLIEQKDKFVKEEFEEKNIEKEDFAKKILGQIVFLYFLQKKGWLGVPKDEKTGKFKKFGQGDRKFLYNLFIRAKERKKNFFNDYLEYLFYSALASGDRKADDYYFKIDDFECKIPFLNGGLFEPLVTNKGYNWRETDILIDNEVFDKIFEVFNLYNFTVKEDEPLDKEVAIDPEMLGKVFENLLESNERKSTGSFYTPREIVHYMCQQSLINYLETNTNIKREILEKFVLEDYSLKLPKEIENNKERIDKFLREIKVADPAVGSGAFLVGMMSEIVKCRSSLDKNKKIFDLKEECIEESLYGVDISPGAVDICQLRLWLSLIVDENNIDDIRPLPNLDYKIMCGNSLIEEFEGMKLWDDKWLGIKIQSKSNEKMDILKNRIKELRVEVPKLIGNKSEWKKKELQIKSLNKELAILQKRNIGKNSTLDKSDSQIKFEILKGLIKKFINISERTEKVKQKQDIEKAQIELMISKLKEEGNSEKLKELEDILKKKRSKPFFLWKMNFIDVFQRDNPGFDIVIANPPYIDSETMVKNNPLLREIYARLFRSAKGNWDLFIVFIERGLNLLRKMGGISYIVPNKLIGAKYSEELRKILITKNIREIRDYSKVNVFKEASVYPVTFIILNREEKNDVSMTLMSSVTDVKILNKIPEKIFYNDLNWARYFVEDITSLKILIKLSQYSQLQSFFKDVSGASTVNEAYEIKKYLQDDFKMKDCKKFINTGTIDRYASLWGFKKANYIKQTYKNPVIKESDIKKINPNRLIQAFSKKIIIGGMTKELECFYDEGEYLAGKSTTIILEGNKDIKFLLALLNSKLISFWYNIFFKSLSLAGGYLRIGNNEIKKIPIPDTSNKEQKPFIEIVDKILSITDDKDYLENQDKQSMVKELEKKIDKMVYELYELTPEEIEIVENFNKN